MVGERFVRFEIDSKKIFVSSHLILVQLYGVIVHVKMEIITADLRWNLLMKHWTKVSFDSASKLSLSFSGLVYEYLTKSIHSTNQSHKNETLRRGMSIAVHPSERPAPPVRRTPSMNTHHFNNNSTKVHMKYTQEIVQINHTDDFPPPPPDFLLSNDPTPVVTTTNSTNSTTTNTNANDPHSSLLAEIQRGFKLRKTVIDRDRSAPRIR